MAYACTFSFPRSFIIHKWMRESILINQLCTFGFFQPQCSSCVANDKEIAELKQRIRYLQSDMYYLYTPSTQEAD